MNKHIIFSFAAVALLAAGCASKPKTVPPESEIKWPVPDTRAAPAPAPKYVPTPATPTGPYVYNQQLMSQPVVLYSQPQADAIVDQFKSNLDKLGNPRMLIYVNRELVDQQSGMRVSARSQTVDTTHVVTTTNAPGDTNAPGRNVTDTTRTSANNTFANNSKPAPTLADRQTVRDVERLMGRPLRAANVSLVDQGIASQLISDRQLDAITTESEQARKDREAVGKIADVVVEVLISSRNVNVQELTGEKTYSVPDIQATAIRLKDSKVIGQASAADLMNKAGGASAVARNYTPQDVTEATSLALMEDILKSQGN